MASKFNVFIDSNVLLSFYAFPSDDLLQLEQLVSEVKAGNINLLITEQIKQEVRRNREAKIAEVLKDFGARLEIDKFPMMIRHYADFKDLCVITDKYKKIKKELVDQLKEDIRTRKLPADKTIEELMSSAHLRVADPETMDRARFRVSIGNPPGKGGSLGDAINWELILQVGGFAEDLHAVTFDRDYLSPVDASRFNEFLADEWEETNLGSVYLFPNLRDLFVEILPKIKLSAEAALQTTRSHIEPDDFFDLDEPFPDDSSTHEPVEPLEAAVADLESSISFRNTHSAIARMSDLTQLSDDQARRLFNAAVHNSQICSIATDDDVFSFFQRLNEVHGRNLSPEIQAEFKSYYLGDD